MTGEYLHNLDSKGRLFIPARLREELGSVLYVTVSREPCLSVYSAASWQAFADKCAAMPYVNQLRMRPLFSLAARCEVDSQGRILLPQNLRAFASLTGETAIVGVNNHAEIWDLSRWQQMSAAEMTPENIAAVMQALEF